MLPIPSPIVCNNTMDKKFLLRLEQSNICGSVTTNKVFNWPLGSGASPLVSVAYFLQDTSYIHWFNLPKQSPRNKQRIQKKKSTPSKFYQTAFAYIHRMQSWKRYTSHRVLREVVTRSTCWKKEEIPEKKTNHRPCTNIWLLAGHNKGRLGTRF